MEITREDAGAGRLALRFAGAFPAAVVPAMRGRIRDLVGEQPGPIDLDLTGVESMDGSTMAVLLDLRHELDARVTGAHDVVKRLYELYDAAGRAAGAQAQCRARKCPRADRPRGGGLG